MREEALTPALVEAARARDPRAFEQLYRLLGPSIYGFVMNHTRNASWADDVTSETFLEAIRGIGRFEGTPEGLRAWVFRIARNCMVDVARRESRRAHAPLDDAETIFETAPGPEQRAVASVERDELEHLVDDLPPDQREVVLYRFVADLPISDVAELVGKTEGAVKALQHRALRGLARRMNVDRP